jgi:hypothetical protein
VVRPRRGAPCDYHRIAAALRRLVERGVRGFALGERREPNAGSREQKKR